MPYRLDIPGQVSEFQLRAIEAVATLVPENGCVVEVGSLFGLSSYAWAKSVPQSASVFCIDPWEGNEGIRVMERQYGVTYGIEQFRIHTEDCPNLTPIQAYSPQGVQDWSRPVDLYYEDAVHHNPILKQNIDFWTSHLTPTGIVCGDDYRPRFLDVRTAAEELAETRGRKLWVVDFFWCVLPDPQLVPAAVGVAQILAGLIDEVAATRAGSRAHIAIGPLLPLPDTLTVSAAAPLNVRIVNNGGTTWPTLAKGKLNLLAQFVDDDDKVLAEDTTSLGVSQLSYDEAVDLPIILPFSEDLPKTVRLRLTLAEKPAPDEQARIDSFETPIGIDRADAKTYALGQLLSLGSNAECSPGRGKGWWPAERLHSWTRGDQSDLMIDLEPATSEREWLNILLHPFVVAETHPAQTLKLFADDVELLVVRISSRCAISVPLPPREGRTLRVRIESPDACKISDKLPGNSDHRVVGFAVETIVVSPAPMTL